MITREFKLYLNAGVGVAPVINANQFDQDEEWIFTLLQNDGTVYTPSTGAIIGLKQDGTTILNAGTVNSAGQVVITETEQMTAVPGSNLFEILIDGNTHGTANFVVFVERRPGDIDNPSESDISLFQEAITAAGNVTQFQADISALQTGLSQETQTRQTQDASLASQIAQEASARSQQDAVLQAEIDQIIAPSGEAPSAAEVENARIGADGITYDTLGNAIRTQVSDLKNALFDTVTWNGIPSEWGIGGVARTTGSNSTATNRLRLVNYPSDLNGADIIIVPNGYKIAVYGWTASDSGYMGVWNGTQFQTTTTVILTTNIDLRYLKEKGANYFRLMFARTDDADFSDTSEIELLQFKRYDSKIDKNNAKVDQIDSEINDIENAFSSLGSVSIYNKTGYTLGSDTKPQCMAFSVTFSKFATSIEKIIIPVKTSTNASVTVSLADARTTEYNALAEKTVTASTTQQYVTLDVNKILSPDTEYWIRLDAESGVLEFKAEVADFSNEYVTFGATRWANTGHNNGSTNANMNFYGAIYAVTLHEYEDIIEGKIPSYYDNTSLALFESVAVIGDSYSSGAIYGVEGATGGRHDNMSWLKILGREKGFEATLYSSPGWNTEDWLDDTGSYGLTAMLADTPKQLYFIMLGINSEDTTGTIADCNADYTLNNNNTFYGRYGTIIGHIKDHAPNAKIICIIPTLGSADRHTGIEEVSTFYGVPNVDSMDDAYFSSDFYKNNLSQGHPVGITYAGMANAIDRLSCKCIQENPSYFVTFTG